VRQLMTYLTDADLLPPLVTGVSRQTEYDWLDKNMTDWRLEVDLAVEYDWRRLANNVTGGGA